MESHVARGGRSSEVPRFGIRDLSSGRLAEGKGVIKRASSEEIQHSHNYCFSKRREKP